MGSPLIASLYAAPLGLMGLGLTAHVIMLRAKTGISIMDGGNIQLAERIRRHGNFIENVPFILLLMALAELNGVANLWLHVSGTLLIIGRIAGASLSFVAALTAIGSILFYAFAK